MSGVSAPLLKSTRLQEVAWQEKMEKVDAIRQDGGAEGSESAGPEFEVAQLVAWKYWSWLEWIRVSQSSL